MKNKEKYIYFFILFIVTILGYQELLTANPVLKHDFVNWDDPVYIMSNPFFNEFSWKDLFTKFYMGNYHPFTMLSLCIDNWIGGEKANVFFIHNLLLHIGSVFFLFFIAALLSKGQAVTLTGVIILTDWYNGRWLTKKALIEKIPFVILSIGFGLLALTAQKFGKSTGQIDLYGWQIILTGFYGLMKYTMMFVLPINLSCYHPYFFTKSDALPAIMYIAPLLATGITTFVLVKYKKHKLVIFGLLFYIGTFLPLLQFLPVGNQIIAERYTYIPYIGLGILLMGWLLSLSKEKQLKFQIGISIAIVIMLFLTHQRVRVWRNTEVLWTDMLDKYPNSAIAYTNRGYWYNQVGRYKEGLADANAGIAIEPKNYQLWDNRGVAHQSMKLYKEAVEDYTTSLSIRDNNTVPLINRGILYTDQLKEYDKGIADFQKLLALNPEYYDAMCNMGIAYLKKQSYQEAKNTLGKAIQIDSNDYRAYELLAIVLTNLGDNTNAKINSDKAAQLKAKNSN